jgi:chromate transporter
MNVFALYLLLLKATISAFSGLSALPIIRDELVVNRRVLTNEQMNTALVAGRVSPGPIGMYVVSIGYTVAGLPGAVAAWLALITPALLVIPILRYIGVRAEQPVIREALNAVVIASVGLTLATLWPLAVSGITGWLTGAGALAGFTYTLARHRSA